MAVDPKTPLELDEPGGEPGAIGSEVESADSAPVVKAVNAIIVKAISEGASDIHLEPVRQGTRVRFRIDGLLAEQMTFPLALGPALTSRVKVMARLDLAERRRPQDGTLDIRLEKRNVHLSVSVMPTATGERMVLRVMDKASFALDLEVLGFLSTDLERIHRAIQQPTGLVLVAGPKGSGPKSTLYALLERLNSPDTCILTAENPIEFNLDGIGQVQVKEELGYTYTAALSAFLTQDPDAVMIQELRESELARMAVDVAQEHCLILGSVIAGDSGEAVGRLLDLEVQPTLAAAALRLVIAQRGIRRLCRDCREEYSPAPEQLEAAGIRKVVRPAEVGAGVTLYRPVGCDRCGSRGYRGRLLVYELLEISSRIRDAIATGTPPERIRQLGIDDGMETIAGNAWRRTLEGQTSLEECLKVM